MKQRKLVSAEVRQSLARPCLCGCGAIIPADVRGRPRSWVRGHHSLGKKHSPEWAAKQSAGLKAAWANDSKFQTMRSQSPEFVEKRIARLRGRKRGKMPAISKALTGRKLSAAHRAKSAKGWLTGPNNLSPEAQLRRNKSISEQRKGTHGYGRAARDRLDHFNALHWIIRDPCGVIHEFDNLQSWCRANQWRFEPDEFPGSKLPLWHRAALGFNGQQRTDRKGCHHWRGWTLVSVVERKEPGAPDLLGRNVQ